MSLFFFYVLACFLSVSAYLLIVARALYFDILSNPYLWMWYAPGPLFIGMSISLLFAGLVQWVYRCNIEGDRWVAKDTWGQNVAFEAKDIVSVRHYDIPFMPLAKIGLSHCKWSVWVPKSAVLGKLADNLIDQTAN